MMCMALHHALPSAAFWKQTPLHRTPQRALLGMTGWQEVRQPLPPTPDKSDTPLVFETRQASNRSSAQVREPSSMCPLDLLIGEAVMFQHETSSLEVILEILHHLMVWYHGEN